MKSIAIACAVATAATGFSGAAFADRGDGDRRFDRQDRREERREQRREERRDDRREHRAAIRGQIGGGVPQASYPQYQQRYHAQPAPRASYHYGTTYPSYGYNYNYVAPRSSYYVGGYVPYQYRQRHYYVSDWQSYNLYAPPYGHQWVRTDTGDFLLMAIATGLIANLLMNR